MGEAAHCPGGQAQGGVHAVQGPRYTLLGSPFALDLGLLSQAVPGPAGLWALQVDGGF